MGQYATDWRDVLRGYVPPDISLRSHVVHTTEEKKEPRIREPRPYDRASRRADLASALQEWADDYEGTHSVFED